VPVRARRASRAGAFHPAHFGLTWLTIGVVKYSVEHDDGHYPVLPFARQGSPCVTGEGTVLRHKEGWRLNPFGEKGNESGGRIFPERRKEPLRWDGTRKVWNDVPQCIRLPTRASKRPGAQAVTGDAEMLLACGRAGRSVV